MRLALLEIALLQVPCLFSHPGCLAAQGWFARQLLKDLLRNYTSSLRPVENTERVMNITLRITLSQIIDMDERNQILTAYLWIRQIWQDANLRWDKNEYDGLDNIRIPSGLVWKPDIVLYNSADDRFTGSMETNVVIQNNGQITWDSPSITKSSCRVDVSYFPFDRQQCRLTFGSWTYNGNQIDLVSGMDGGDLSDFIANVEWEVLGMPAAKNVIKYGCCSDPYPDVTYTILLKRRASFYVFNLLLPCVMLSFLAPLGFYLPAESGEKVSLGVTVLLSLTVFQLMVAESMPPSENVPLIGKYYIATMSLITASTALTIFVMNVHHCGPEARPVPPWVKSLVLGYLARIFLVYDMGESCWDRDAPGIRSGGGADGATPDIGAARRHGRRKRSGGRGRGAASAPTRKGEANGGVEERRGAAPPRHTVVVRLEGAGAAGGAAPCTTRAEPQRGPAPRRAGAGRDENNGWRRRDEEEDEEVMGFSSNDEGGGGEDRDEDRQGEEDGEDESEELRARRRVAEDVEAIARCFREQRAGQARVLEWRRVARVMDRCFMWLFFLMVFLMSLMIVVNAA
ncbi:neuronal acetylcholine receptor subunit alpha-10-like [Petromyzon marinus]|uniref:neuronal acetylcholine receptor subunit alpha-10-like n=1 Tax=Petromyzon marinus TaxID=7757 RepID=UPI003F6F6BA3